MKTKAWIKRNQSSSLFIWKNKRIIHRIFFFFQIYLSDCEWLRDITEVPSLVLSRIYIVGRIWNSYFLALSHVARFYSTHVYFFCNTPHTRKIKKVEFHTSKNISKLIKQSNQSRQDTFIHFGMSISCKQGR